MTCCSLSKSQKYILFTAHVQETALTTHAQYTINQNHKRRITYLSGGYCRRTKYPDTRFSRELSTLLACTDNPIKFRYNTILTPWCHECFIFLIYFTNCHWTHSCMGNNFPWYNGSILRLVIGRVLLNILLRIHVHKPYTCLFWMEVDFSRIFVHNSCINTRKVLRHDTILRSMIPC